jgi:hypothetical protein
MDGPRADESTQLRSNPDGCEWRSDIPFAHRCPDFACGTDVRVLIVELKIERGTYQGAHKADYLRLVRRKLPRTSATSHCSVHDDSQRYAELTLAATTFSPMCSLETGLHADGFLRVLVSFPVCAFQLWSRPAIRGSSCTSKNRPGDLGCFRVTGDPRRMGASDRC